MRYQQNRYKNPVLLNGDLLAAVDVETSGLVPGVNDILQVAVIPLTSQYEPHPEAGFFEVKLKPFRPENFDHESTKVNRITFGSAMKTGLEPSMAADLLTAWFEKLGLGQRKRLVPVGHNYMMFDRLFLIDWLGPKNYEYIFSHLVRDTLSISTYVNDLADWRAEAVPFPKYALGSLCTRLGVERGLAHNAISDAMAAARCYRRLLDLPLITPCEVTRMTERQKTGYRAGWNQAIADVEGDVESVNPFPPSEIEYEFWEQGYKDSKMNMAVREEHDSQC
jgi:DNA polymerase III epsilon subunit-like protein